MFDCEVGLCQPRLPERVPDVLGGRVLWCVGDGVKCSGSGFLPFGEALKEGLSRGCSFDLWRCSPGR